MSGSVNRVTLIGRLGRDPDLKYTPGGVAVAKFSLATDEVFKDKSGEKQQRTEWHNIVAWEKLAEIVKQYLVKGSQVYIEGTIKSHKYKGRDHTEKTAYEIVARSLTMLGGGTPKTTETEPLREEPAQVSLAGQPVTPENPITDDELGF